MFPIVAPIAVCWWLSLLGLALFKSTDVVISRTQIDAAHLVVTARIEDGAAGRILVEQDWTDGNTQGTLTVKRLRDRNVPDGQVCLIPLTRNPDGTLEVTVVPGSEPPRRYVYKWSAETESQLRRLIDGVR